MPTAGFDHPAGACRAPAARGPDDVRVLRTERPLDPVRTLSSLQRSSADPTQTRTPDGALWRATRTPGGPATLAIRADPATGAVTARAWGAGAEAALDQFPALVGAEDDRAGFDPGAGPVGRLAKRFGDWRICRTGQVWEALFPAVLEQKVTSTEAWRSWRELVRRFGERAPGPADGPELWIAPGADVVRRLPSWEWHRAGVGPERMRTLLRCARVADRLQQSVRLDAEQAERRLRVVPGVGAWTAAEVLQRAHGCPDAVSVGDYNLPKAVGWVLAGRPYDDEQMLAALERWRGHRYRVTRLVEFSGRRPPRRGPRLPPRDYRSI